MYINVSLGSSKRLYSYYCDDNNVKVGDHVLVPVNNYETHGIVREVDVMPVIENSLIKDVILVLRNVDIMSQSEVQSFKDKLNETFPFFKDLLKTMKIGGQKCEKS